jgi:hypothetical protein
LLEESITERDISKFRRVIVELSQASLDDRPVERRDVESLRIGVDRQTEGSFDPFAFLLNRLPVIELVLSLPDRLPGVQRRLNLFASTVELVQLVNELKVESGLLVSRVEERTTLLVQFALMASGAEARHRNARDD